MHCIHFVFPSLVWLANWNMMKLDDTRFTLIENKVSNKHDNGINAEFDNNFYCRYGDKKNTFMFLEKIEWSK